MKEATGGALLMGLVATILLVFIIFACFFISYGKTFKKKNQVINYIEQREGLHVDQIEDFLINEAKYNWNAKKADISCYFVCKGTGASQVFKGFVMKVTLYMTFQKTLINYAFDFDLPVSGETITISSGLIYDTIAGAANKRAESNNQLGIYCEPCK